MIERVMEHFKDRTEAFDDYYPCTREGCELPHVHSWLRLFAFIYNNAKRRRRHVKFRLLTRMIGGGRMA